MVAPAPRRSEELKRASKFLFGAFKSRAPPKADAKADATECSSSCVGDAENGARETYPTVQARTEGTAKMKYRLLSSWSSYWLRLENDVLCVYGSDPASAKGRGEEPKFRLLLTRMALRGLNANSFSLKYTEEDGKEGRTFSFRVPDGHRDQWFFALQKVQGLARRVCDFYEVGKKLGQGANSKVFHCINRFTGATFALKQMVNPEDKQAREQFLTELQFLRMLGKNGHPSIPALEDYFFNEDGRMELVVELLAGGELLSRIAEKTAFTEEEAAVVFKQILDGVAHIHAQGIAHRDIKPQNLLFESDAPDARIKITDFDLAKGAYGEEWKAFTPCGTYEYMAPEVCRFDGMAYSQAVDMWSLGCVLFCLLSGKPPFPEEDANDTITLRQRVMCGEWSFEDPTWQSVSAEAKDLVASLLKTDPMARPSAAVAAAHPWLTGQDPMSPKAPRTLLCSPRILTEALSGTHDAFTPPDTPLTPDRAAAGGPSGGLGIERGEAAPASPVVLNSPGAGASGRPPLYNGLRAPVGGTPRGRAGRMRGPAAASSSARLQGNIFGGGSARYGYAARAANREMRMAADQAMLRTSTTERLAKLPQGATYARCGSGRLVAVQVNRASLEAVTASLAASSVGGPSRYATGPTTPAAVSGVATPCTMRSGVSTPADGRSTPAGAVTPRGEPTTPDGSAHAGTIYLSRVSGRMAGPGASVTDLALLPEGAVVDPDIDMLEVAVADGDGGIPVFLSHVSNSGRLSIASNDSGARDAAAIYVRRTGSGRMLPVPNMETDLDNLPEDAVATDLHPIMNSTAQRSSGAMSGSSGGSPSARAMLECTPSGRPIDPSHVELYDALDLYVKQSSLDSALARARGSYTDLASVSEDEACEPVLVTVLHEGEDVPTGGLMLDSEEERRLNEAIHIRRSSGDAEGN